MAAIHRAYVFDVNSYTAMIGPIVERLILNDWDMLRAKATQIASSKTYIWAMLEDHRLYAGDLGHEETEFDTIESRTWFWMMVILASFWQPVRTPVNYVPSITEALRQVGEGNQVITKLTVGKTLCALLQPQLVSDPIIQRSCDKWPFWSHRELSGWLDNTDVNDLLAHLLPLQERLAPSGSQDDKTRQQALAYQAAIRMLSLAQQVEHGLFLAIVD